MQKKEEFERLTGSVLNRLSREKDFGSSVHTNTAEILKLCIALNKRITEQREYIDELQKKILITEKNLNLLIRELVRSGYLRVGEKRNYLRRNIHSVEAVIALLEKKKIVNRKELMQELKKGRATEKKKKKPSIAFAKFS
ncbi:MAG: hypothetical protein ACOYVJ_04235 [Nitrospirota bacterium]